MLILFFCSLFLYFLFFFFFQAEDGIRDPLVTGVQTCALPISADAANDLLCPVVLEGVGAGGPDNQDTDGAAIPTANCHGEQATKGQARLDWCVWRGTVEEVPLVDVTGTLENGRQDAATLTV